MKAAVAVTVLSVVLYLLISQSEKYRSGRRDHRYAFVDTNPVRRVSGFFDNCSPENMEDCSRNNLYKGLPLP